MPPVQDDPKPGDLIEISRFGYQHWAIYVGGGYVVHMAPPSEYSGAGSSSIMSVFGNRAYVKKELLQDVAGGYSYKVNNKYDAERAPLPPGKIVQRAEELVGQELPYALTSDNCEHFVTDIRYGVKISTQVESAATYATWGALGAAALGVVAFMVNRNRRQNQ